MVVDFPGAMTEFAKVKPGEFFIYLEDGEAALAMKIFDASSPEKKAAVMSFSTAIHASMTPPTVLESNFQNRAVCVVRDVVIRPPFQMNKLHSNSLSLERPGPVIFAVGATYIRAHDRRGTIDVDLATGATEQSRAHPGSIWLDNWEIVWVGRSAEKILCERGKPAAEVGSKSGG
jgi:hypothetical protein